MEDISCASGTRPLYLYQNTAQTLCVYTARQDETVSLCSEGRLVTESDL